MRRSRLAIKLILVILALLCIPFFLLMILTNEQVSIYARTHLSAEPYAVFDSIVNYLSMGFTILLGVVVYYQAQKINDLESTQYDIFIGVDKLDYSYLFDDILIKNASPNSDFYVVQSFSKTRKNFMTSLKVDSHAKEKPIFLPLSFITKNQLVITSLDFKKIYLTINTEDAKEYKQTFSNVNDIGAIHGIFADNSNFLFGVGMMVPDSFKVSQLGLTFDIEVHDQIGRKHTSEIQVSLKNVSNFYYLESSKSQTHSL